MDRNGARPQTTDRDRDHQGRKQGGGVRQNGGSVDVEHQRNKRQKLSSSGRSDTSEHISPANLECFKTLPMDEKLNSIFELLTEVRIANVRIDRVESKLSYLEKETDYNSTRLKQLEYHSIDSEARSRRLNLIFRGIPEIYFEEDCLKLVREFMKKHLNIKEADNIQIQRAHRLGAPGRGRDGNRKSRPLIVCFLKDSDVQLILSTTHRLKGKPELGVNRDYPKEITNARSKLWPAYKDLKGKHPREVHIGYPAKIIVKGKIVHDEFPDWQMVMKKPQNHQQTQSQSVNIDLIDRNPFNILSQQDSSDMETSSDDEDNDENNEEGSANRGSEAGTKSNRNNPYSKAMFDSENPQRRRAAQLIPPTTKERDEPNKDTSTENGESLSIQSETNSGSQTKTSRTETSVINQTTTNCSTESENTTSQASESTNAT